MSDVLPLLFSLNAIKQHYNQVLEIKNDKYTDTDIYTDGSQAPVNSKIGVDVGVYTPNNSDIMLADNTSIFTVEMTAVLIGITLEMTNKLIIVNVSKPVIQSGQ